ncbi:alpha-(1,3)-fucosyltransferase C-like [Ostrinia furnacalis]|uniref:alpha-(1,3)-fucosyltransferase C-like n=1 Tax=Ostrinia furnacalis TaxID=93504 RepID=UPI00103DB9FC|nr:alpha-(1,3)-fucosyltransferase C-like [Ostrinia furnacalis]
MYPGPRHRGGVRLYFAVVLVVATVGFMYAVLPTRVTYDYTKQMDNILFQFNVTPHQPMKFILQWAPRYSPFDVMREGQEAFFKLDCEYKNCYVTDNKSFFDDIKNFDAIAFSGNHLPNANNLPAQRSASQKYIFGATESAHNYRVCDPVFDGFFNWTWTYRLDSDVRWGYITIYDLDGKKVGPKRDMTWPELAPVSDEFKKKLDSKSKVVAWFVSHCNTLSRRENFVRQLQREAKTKYGWTVDVYGSCGTLKCPRQSSSHCFDILQRDYYFYLSFENSFAEDYVTEKLLNALNNDAVPVVYGGANYSRFLPPGSYLDARELGPAKLAETMDAIYRNKTRYYEFFRWQNHFRYKETFEPDVCNLCAALNDVGAVSRRTEYQHFRRWWNDEQWNGQDHTC